MRRYVSFFIFALLALGSACGGSSEEGEESPAVILAFEALPPTIDPGMAAALRWDVRNATRIGITTADGERVPLDAAALDAREVEVRPTETTVYRLAARGKDGKTVTREARVSVRAGVLHIVTFAAQPTAVRAGESATLSWATENATAVRILADGTEVPLGDVSPAAGSVEVRPSRTTTYTLRASNATEVREATTTVEVRGGLEVELFADRSRIEFGQETLLRWRARDATRVEIRTGGEVLVDTSELAGSIAVAPTRATVYEAVAHGDGRTAQASATIRVAPVVERFEVAREGPFAVGESVELAWEVLGAAGVRIWTADGWSFDGAASGEVEAEVPSDGRFHLAARLDDEEVTRTLAFDLLQRPEVLSFTATPDALTVPEGESRAVEFAWEALRAERVEIRDEGGALVVEGAAAGTAEVQVASSGRYTLTAFNAAGVATRAVEVRTYPPPAIDAFSALPAHVAVGEPFALHWSTRGALVEILRNGVPVHGGPAGEGSLYLTIVEDARFALRVANEVGDTVERDLVVTVGPPTILAFESDRIRQGPGSSVEFTWTALGGISLVLSGPGGAVCSTMDPAEIPSGSCTAFLPSVPGTYRFTLQLANGLGQTDTAVIDVEVVDGPAILAFYADQSRITLGDELTFYWTTAVDADGQAPTLVLSDGADVYDLGDADPLSGSAAIVPLRSGPRTFRLTASTPGTTSAVRELTLSVLEPPQLTVYPPVGDYVPGTGPAVLLWESSHAVEVEIVQLDDQGGETVGYFVNPALVAAGSIDLHPPAPGATYRVIARNDLGASIAEEVHVSWAVPTIDVFVAVPDEVAVRGVAELQWMASSGADLKLSPQPLLPTEPFVDLADDPAVTTIPLGSCGPQQQAGEACAVVQLPFTFPFGGQSFDRVLVHEDGFLGFDTSYAGGFAGVAELPSTQAAHVALAPYWQPLRRTVPGAAREGRILYRTTIDATGVYAVIQWDGFWTEEATAADPAHLDFQVVLFPDGSFDFRYGTMEGPGASGEGASIGYQFPGGVEGRSISFQQAFVRGVGDLAFGLRWSALPTMGGVRTVHLHPGTVTFTLSADNGIDVVSAQTTVTVHPGVRLDEVRVVEPYPQVNEPFTITWTAERHARVQVEEPKADPNDPTEPVVVLCEVEPDDPQECTLVRSTTGTETFVVRAVGVLPGDEAVEAIEVRIYPTFRIDAFTATPNPVVVGEEVTLSWATTGASTIELTANGTVVDVSGLSPAGDAIDVVVEEDTSFVLTASASDGRVLTRTLEVTAEEPPPDDGTGQQDP